MPRARGQIVTSTPTPTDDGQKNGPKGVERGSLLVALGSVLVAAVALVFSFVTYRDQAELESRQRAIAREIDERQAAPVLVGGVERPLRGRRIRVVPETGAQFRKPAERLLWDAEKLVIPVRNVGAGTAVLPFSRVWFDEDNRQCEGPLSVVTGARVWDWEEKFRAGYYVVRPGESWQLIYREPADEDWEQMSQKMSVTFLLRYTDALGWFARWTCLSYTRGCANPDGRSTMCDTAC